MADALLWWQLDAAKRGRGGAVTRRGGDGEPRSRAGEFEHHDDDGDDDREDGCGGGEHPGAGGFGIVLAERLVGLFGAACEFDESIANVAGAEIPEGQRHSQQDEASEDEHMVGDTPAEEAHHRIAPGEDEEGRGADELAVGLAQAFVRACGNTGAARAVGAEFGVQHENQAAQEHHGAQDVDEPQWQVEWVADVVHEAASWPACLNVAGHNRHGRPCLTPAKATKLPGYQASRLQAPGYQKNRGDWQNQSVQTGKASQPTPQSAAARQRSARRGTPLSML